MLTKAGFKGYYNKYESAEKSCKWEKCPVCKGTKMFEDDEGYPDTCPECGGSGFVKQENVAQ